MAIGTVVGIVGTGVTVARHRFIVKRVYKGLEVDDGAESSGNEAIKRRWKFADGWVDDEQTILTGVPIRRNVAGNFYIGERETPEVMDRAWIEGDERSGFKVVENDLGGREVATFTWSKDMTHDEEEDLEWEADVDSLFVKIIARSRNATDATILIYEYDENGDFVTGPGPDEEVASLTFSNPRGESDLILHEVPQGHALTIYIADNGGARNVVVKLILRERTG